MTAYTLPDMTRPDVGAPLFSTWSAGTPERQKAVVEAIATAWERRPWPSPGLLGYHVYLGTDGDTVLHHSQWRDLPAYEGFARTGRQERNDEIDAAVPGLRRLRLLRTVRHRSTQPPAGAPAPGCVVFVVAEFEEADPLRQRQWADERIEALATDPEPPAGLVAAHFHLTTDGTRTVNYAEWESTQAYDAALARSGAGVGSTPPPWDRVRGFPGLRSLTAGRFHLAWNMYRP